MITSGKLRSGKNIGKTNLNKNELALPKKLYSSANAGVHSIFSGGKLGAQAILEKEGVLGGWRRSLSGNWIR